VTEPHPNAPTTTQVAKNTVSRAIPHSQARAAQMEASGVDDWRLFERFRAAGPAGALAPARVALRAGARVPRSKDLRGMIPRSQALTLPAPTAQRLRCGLRGSSDVLDRRLVNDRPRITRTACEAIEPSPRPHRH
jgi:hypothetical protein